MCEKGYFQLHKNFIQVTGNHVVRFSTSSKLSIRRILGKQRNHIAVEGFSGCEGFDSEARRNWEDFELAKTMVLGLSGPSSTRAFTLY